MPKYSLISLVLLFFPFWATGQTDSVLVQLQPFFYQQPLQLDNPVEEGTNTYSISLFRCYISAIELTQNGAAVWQQTNSYHLADAADSTSLDRVLHIPEGLEYDGVRFNLGIDSLTNVSGAYGGDLDPTKGMYWTWNSGYINYKLEGTRTDSSGTVQNFEFHLGGYMQPHPTVHAIQHSVTAGEPINLIVDVGVFLTGLDLAKQHHVMSPGAEARELSKKAAESFATTN